jgi:hypothetical protein
LKRITGGTQVQVVGKQNDATPARARDTTFTAIDKDTDIYGGRGRGKEINDGWR